jgi:hypothetical protein
MATVVRSVVAILAALAVALVLIVAVEIASNAVHPFPPEFTGTKEEVCRHVENYPSWILALAIPAWGGTTFLSSWIATRIGSRIHGLVIGLLLLSAVICNMSMLPYPLWFEALNLLVFPLATLLGMRSGRREPKTPIPADQ